MDIGVYTVIAWVVGGYLAYCWARPLKDLLIKALGGSPKGEMLRVNYRNNELEREVQHLEHFRRFAESIEVYVGNYPAWKAQQEYREAMANFGIPLSGNYPVVGVDCGYPTHAENVDIYLGRVVDAFAKLSKQAPEIKSYGYETTENLSCARGNCYLQQPERTLN